MICYNISIWESALQRKPTLKWKKSNLIKKKRKKMSVGTARNLKKESEADKITHFLS